MRRFICLAGLCALAGACGGASEERVSALEARVAQLSGGGSSASADTDRLSAIEQQLAVVQREVANNEQPAAAAAAPAPAPTPAPSSGNQGGVLDAMIWSNVDAALGADVGGVTTAGDTYSIRRAWLAREVAALQNPGRAPKLAAAPGGVVIRAIKPKSLAAQLGLQNADVITAIDDHPVSSGSDIASALHAARGGETHVKLLRKKREVTLDYKLVD